MPQSTGRNASKTPQSRRNISTEFVHLSSARSFRPSSNLFKTVFDLQSESREMDRTWCRLYLCQTISKHFARLHLDKSHFWSRAPLLQEERIQLDVSRYTSGALALDHTQRCSGITTRDLLCRLTCLLGMASKLQYPVSLLSQALPSQAPESAATNAASPLLSAIVDCFLFDAVIGYQPCLPRNHDAVPLALNRSASPAQSESICQH